MRPVWYQEPQRTTIEVVFNTKHNPGTDNHLDAVLENYFRSKGVPYKDGVIKL